MRTKMLLIRKKHGISFSLAQEAFFDKKRIIAKDITHSISESRYFCFGKVNGKVITVRFTIRRAALRIFGAGYWREGVEKYEKQNQ
jgi:hypothetical protein